MAKRYFAFNSLAGAQRANNNVSEITTAGRFDATYVGSAIQTPASADFILVKQPFMDGSASIVGTMYFRFDCYQQNTSSTSPILMKNAGANAYRLTLVSGNTYQFQYWNSGTTAWVNWGPTFTIAQAVNTTCRLKLIPGTSFEMMVATVTVATGSAPVNAAAAVDEFQIGGSGNASTAYSQIMCADYDIADSHFMAKLPNAEGTYNSDGTGAYTDVNEVNLNDGTAINLPAVGNHRTFTKAAIAVPVGLMIAGMVINARGRLGGGTVTDGKLLCKQGANDTLSAVKGYGTTFAPKSEFVPLDPATGTVFDQAGYNSAEFGFQAA